MKRFQFPTVAILALLLSASGSSSVLSAQSLSERTVFQQTAETGPSNIISANPFLPLFGYFSGEYEHRIKANLSFALSGSYVRFDERYTNFDAKLRLYPNDKALEGLGISASLGFARIQKNEVYCPTDIPCENQKRSFNTPSFAIGLDYQFLLGKSRSTSVTIGIGAKRYLAGSREDYQGVERVIPTGRLSIGYGF